MQIKFVTLELPVLDNLTPQAIEQVLNTHGQPLRWAITGVEDETYQLEAVVIVAAGDCGC